jgi:DUF4097 and DUF4098 domain-containing protein YvlB
MSRRHRLLLHIAAPVLGALLALLSATAQRAAAQQTARAGGAQANEEWLARCRQRERGEREEHCEVRELSLPALRALHVNARPNGGVEVVAWDRNEIHVTARIQAYGRTRAEATELASQLTIDSADGQVRATGPDGRGERGWSVSYQVSVPRETDLDLQTVNGGLSVSGVSGDLEMLTTNGGISLEGVAGDVRAHTTNGGVSVRLAGGRWMGKGLELRTTNGGITLGVPASFSAHLVASTVHGGLDTDFPITVQGRVGRRVETDLGGGGPTVSLETTNGGIRIRRN